VVTEVIKDRVEDSTGFAERVLATYEDNRQSESFQCKVTAGADRAERWLQHRSYPIESGEYAGGRIEFYTDITDQKRSADALQKAEEQFQSLVDAVEEYAIFRLDRDGYVVSWNEGAKAIKGYESDEIIGEHFSRLYTQEDRKASMPQRNLERARRRGSIEDEGWRVRKDGTRFWGNVTISAIHDQDGVHQGFLKVTRDMTERYEREQALKDTAESRTRSSRSITSTTSPMSTNVRRTFSVTPKRSYSGRRYGRCSLPISRIYERLSGRR